MKKFLSLLSIDNWLRISTILANIFLILTILYTYNNFSQQIYNDNRNFSVSLFKDYSDLVLNKNNRHFLDTSYTYHLDRISEDYKYFVGFVLFYAESIYNIMWENEAWTNTVEYMLDPHLKYIQWGKLLDKAYSKRFVNFCNELISKNRIYHAD